MKVSNVSINPVMVNQIGGGILEFEIKGRPYSLSLKDVQEAFDFPPGNPVYPRFLVGELDLLCKMATGGEQMDFSSKSTRIRNPSLAYARKAIAETLFSRDKTGSCGAKDFHTLVAGIRATINFNPVDRSDIYGDQAESSLAFVLAKQLESYRGKIIGFVKKKMTPAPIEIGVLITTILRAANVKVSPNAVVLEPALMDIPFLYTQHFLVPPTDKLYYKF